MLSADHCLRMGTQWVRGNSPAVLAVLLPVGKEGSHVRKIGLCERNPWMVHIVRSLQK